MNKLLSKLYRLYFSVRRVFLLKINLKYKYRIIGFSERTLQVSLQCCATRAFFTENLLNIVYEKDIISQIIPEQACYLGIILGDGLRSGQVKLPNNEKKITLESCDHSKEKTQIIFDRYGNVIFLHPVNNERCVINLNQVISKRDLINLFNSEVAFNLGLQFGYRKPPAEACSSSISKNKNHLRLVRTV